MSHRILILWTILIGALTLSAPAASADWPVVESQTRSFGAIVDDGSAGSVAWLNPANAMASDNAYATAFIGQWPAGQISHFLKATSAGFSIPSSATISGIKIGVEANHGGSDTPHLAVYLRRAGLLVAYKTVDLTGGAVDTTYSLGSNSDPWAVGWSAGDINAADFGAAFCAVAGSAATISVDSLTLTVYYLPPAPYALHLPLVGR